ncbi:hypothetical protein ACFX13_046317 [Malus domestica]
MGNYGTREESAVMTNAQVQQLSTLVKNGGGEGKQNHNRSISDLIDLSTPRNFYDPLGALDSWDASTPSAPCD